MRIMNSVGVFALVACANTSQTQLDLKFVPSNFPASEVQRELGTAFQYLPPTERGKATADFVAELNGYYDYLRQHCTQAEAELLSEMVFWFGYSQDLPKTPAIAAYLKQREPDFGAVDPDFRVAGRNYGGPQGPSPACTAAIEKYHRSS